MKILIINGPNLNLLGKREDVYGTKTLSEINYLIENFCINKGIKVDFFQSNTEGEIINFIQNNYEKSDGIVINPAGYTHTSVAIRDTISAVNIPAVEVHLTNIHSREEFRKHSFIAPVCIGQISGFGWNSYILGIEALKNHIDSLK